MVQLGLCDWDDRFQKLDKNGDPLLMLNKVINWNIFRPALETIKGC